MLLNRRGVLRFLAAPAIVTASNLMPIKAFAEADPFPGWIWYDPTGRRELKLMFTCSMDPDTGLVTKRDYKTGAILETYYTSPFGDV